MTDVPASGGKVGQPVLIGGAYEAAELDAKQAIKQAIKKKFKDFSNKLNCSIQKGRLYKMSKIDDFKFRLFFELKVQYLI